MSSVSLNEFGSSLSKAYIYISLAKDHRLQPLQDDSKQLFLHTSVSLAVASWDAYIKKICVEFFSNTSSPNNYLAAHFHGLIKENFQEAKKKFNTPNAENTRNILINYTGYDPWSDWVWTNKRFSGQQTRQLLDDILKVRHSFAHGHTMPVFSWNANRHGSARLTITNVKLCLDLINFLAAKVDNGLSRHAAAITQNSPPW